MPSFNEISQWVMAGTALLSGIISGQMLAIGIANWAARGLPEVSWTECRTRSVVEISFHPSRCWCYGIRLRRLSAKS
jgi:hypothetical protein